MSNLSAKAFACLRIAATQPGAERAAMAQAAEDVYGRKPILRKCEELQRRGYVGLNMGNMILTDKGREALAGEQP